MEIISTTNYVKEGLMVFLICAVICLLAIIFCTLSDKYGHEALTVICLIVIVISAVIGLTGLVSMSLGKTYRVKVNDEITVGELKDAYRIEDYDATNDVWIVKEKK